MPVSFTEEEKENIRKSLRSQCRLLLKDHPADEIKVEDLTAEAGISKGMFYKLYTSKDALLLQVMKEEHRKLFMSSFRLLQDRSMTREERLYAAVSSAIHGMNSSVLSRFWQEDAQSLLQMTMPEFFTGKDSRMKQGFHAFFQEGAGLQVSEDTAFRSILGLLFTDRIHTVMAEDYETILRWMVHGVAVHLFREEEE